MDWEGNTGGGKREIVTQWDDRREKRKTVTEGDRLGDNKERP